MLALIIILSIIAIVFFMMSGAVAAVAADHGGNCEGGPIWILPLLLGLVLAAAAMVVMLDRDRERVMVNMGMAEWKVKGNDVEWKVNDEYRVLWKTHYDKNVKR